MFFGSKVLGAIESSFDSATKYYTEVTKKLGANDFKGPIAQLALKKTNNNNNNKKQHTTSLN